MSRSTACLLVLVLAACSGPATEVSSTSAPSTADTTARTTTIPPTEPTYAAEDVPTLALYLAAIEQGLESTMLEGAAFEEPESLINTGVLFCGLLDEGLSPTDVLRGWVAALSVEGDNPDEDDLLLGGVVLGAAVKFICPEYLEELEL